MTWLAAVFAPARRRSRIFWTLVVLALVAIIGIFDYYAAFEVSLLVFYLFPVSIAVVTMGRAAGAAIAAVSLAVSLLGDIVGGAHYSNRLAPWWNALIVLSTYLVVVWLLAALKSSYTNLLGTQRELEDRVRQRTAALTEEIAERERLEKAVLEISERERRRIGHDLHDGLGQYLTGTALAVQLLADRLEAHHAEEAAEARKAVGFIEQAIGQTRGLARGLLLAEIERDALVPALLELAASVAEQFHVTCEFKCEGEFNLEENGVASHLYRIAQEAARNAVRHGEARRVDIVLTAEEDAVSLTIRDDGIGLAPLAGRGQGLGLRIMAHRAAMIGGEFAINPLPGGGTLVSCRRNASNA